MFKASLVTSNYYCKNRIFDIHDPVSNRDNSIYVIWYLKEMLAKKGIDIATSDINKPEESEVVLYMDILNRLPKTKEIHKSILIINEVAAVMPKNWDFSKHHLFKKIFTFCDDLIDNKQYFKLNSCRPFKRIVPIDISLKNKFCVMIAGNKSSNHPSELYTKRIETVDWFSKNYPSYLDFYGLDWDKRKFSGLLKPLNRLSIARKIFAKKYPSWKGPIGNKFNLLSKYKFSVAFENARSINGYVTGDKIFDPLEAGCIPIYYGAPNVGDYVPKNCFINFEDFGNWSDTLKYMKNLSDTEYVTYLDNIKEYIENIAVRGSHSEYSYVNTLIPEIEKIIYDKR